MADGYSEKERTLLLEVGASIRKFRRELGMTQEQAAEAAGINVTYLSDVERGKRNISLINLARLAEAFGMNLSDILTISSDI